MNIQLQNIVKIFENKVVLNDISITFLEGRINCLMGPSGIGKTTVINLLMGLTKADCGKITGCTGKRIAAVFQEDRLIEHWNAVKNIKLVCSKEITDQRIIQELNKVGIVDYYNKTMEEFSGGMRRRVALVRALMAESEILIIDEPFKGLNDELKIQVIDYVKENTKEKTTIIVTHDKDDMVQLGANLVHL